jgi:hypothetical protein
MRLWRWPQAPYTKDQHDGSALPVIATRISAVLAAILLVGAFTLATVLPPDLPLAAALPMLDHDFVQQAQGYANDYLPSWFWPHVAMPLLVRPAWLVPAALGVVAAGAAATLASSAGPSRSRRRRS